MSTRSTRYCDKCNSIISGTTYMEFKVGHGSSQLSEFPFRANFELCKVCLNDLRVWWRGSEKVPTKVECPYVEAWIGECKKPGDPYCEKHKDKKCRCGKQATHNCSATIGAFVCEYDLCGSCTHHH